jgi:hypothetical protein
MWDSNPHGLRHQILSLACLPISAIAREFRNQACLYQPCCAVFLKSLACQRGR